MRHESIDPQLFIENRARLRELLRPGSLVALNANDIPPTNGDGTLPLTPNSDLFYLSGVGQEETVLLLFPDAVEEKHREILFLRETDEHIAIWEGRKLTREEAQKATGVRNVRWLADFPRLFRQLMCECARVYLNTNEHRRAQPDVESRDARFVREVQSQYPLHRYERLAPLMHRLRAVKSPMEVELIRRAIELTALGFRRALAFTRPGVNEMEIEAEFAHEFIRAGGGFGYQPIVASGRNSCVLHYIENSGVCKKGEVLLLDVGARTAGYQADVTRCIPVNGRFSKRQRDVYDAVLRVLRAAASAAIPGKLPKEWQKEAEAAMERELVDLQLLTTKEIKKQNPELPALKRYFMHGIGHPLGLDTHDVADTNRPIEPGWVLTVEPGIYLPEEGIGIRLENNILVTSDGYVDLTETIPIERVDIEKLMRG